jgi:hypothetical protein
VRGGYQIQELACPRCAIRRTVHLMDGSSFCFNCRVQWSAQPTADARAVRGTIAPPALPVLFGPADQARLAIYRAAVRGGFYTDWPASSAVPS